MKRLIRRAILASITVVGSKSRTSAAIRTSNAGRVEAAGPSRVPVTPATRFDQYVGKSLPIGMTAPRPVTTARRAGSCSGSKRFLTVGLIGDCSRAYDRECRQTRRQSPS